MEFNVGDQVVHWTFGVGRIMGVEERALSQTKPHSSTWCKFVILRSVFQ